MISIIIPSKNEKGIYETCEAIYATCDVDNEIIVIDDFSDKPFKIEGATVIRNERPKGVHQSINLGVKKAKYRYIAIFNARMRFPTKNWASKMIAHLRENKNTLFCTKSGILRFGEEKEEGYRYGADIIMDHENDGKYECLVPKWKKQQKNKVYEIPCVLGANYFMPKSLYGYIKGFELLEGYGGLCSYLSLKVWALGGKVKIAKDVTISNIYYKKGDEKPYIQDMGAYYWNMIVSAFIFLDWEKACNTLHKFKDNEYYQVVRNNLIMKAPEIMKVRNYILKNKKQDINHLIK
jgi:glycosyltransferase involved in cell wall biosynthesis